ncbi:unnamed protein product [Timema podura]|uniref:Alpha-carbonic anhydrase domain-containing protein n=1 Tax=Timema podura TaxID=61482 RepID=A0ABN7NET1_TIMPD|nr:unnamed protein product [Timema podura]
MTEIRYISLRSLLPDTDYYMTYEGSTTYPGCWETTVWIILNKPIYITKQELYALRQLKQGLEETPKAPLGNNARPIQELFHRTVRTNIDFRKEELVVQPFVNDRHTACCSIVRERPTQRLLFNCSRTTDTKLVVQSSANDRHKAGSSVVCERPTQSLFFNCSRTTDTKRVVQSSANDRHTACSLVVREPSAPNIIAE